MIRYRTLTASLLAALVLPVAAQPHFTDARRWVPLPEAVASTRPADLEQARSACHDEVHIGILVEENYDDPMFRLAPSERRLRALEWAREAFRACMEKKGYRPVSG